MSPFFKSRREPDEGERFREQRRRMVEKQLAGRDIDDPVVLQAFRAVPRHIFLPPNTRDSAYDDRAVPIGLGQTMSQPYMVAAMTQQLRPKPGHKVLEVGTGSGYQAAILCEIGCEVYTIERHPQLAETAEAKLLDAGYESVRVVCGDGTQGLPEQAPFDRVLVTAGGPAVPPPLIEQLADGGRLICPVGTESRQVLKVVERHGETLEEQETVPCVFVPLIGRSGW